MRKIEGVEKVTVSLKEGMTVLEFRPGNKVTLASLRRVIKNNGFVSKEATVVAQGTANGRDFVISGTGEKVFATSSPTATPDGRWRFVVEK
ncbi:MAG TPA: hypothetical protein VEC39_10680 [Vicinamibacterales bacterium]|nr:hypothetical protein [Vicinamibacterales bacterium]